MSWVSLRGLPRWRGWAALLCALIAVAGISAAGPPFAQAFAAEPKLSWADTTGYDLGAHHIYDSRSDRELTLGRQPRWRSYKPLITGPAQAADLTPRHALHDLPHGLVHDFYVIAGTTPVLVHNASGCPAEYLRDFVTKRTVNRSATYKSERDAQAFARTKIGRDPVDIGDHKLRSVDGHWQYRAKPSDIADRHAHLERIDPSTGEVLENWHLRW